MLTNGITLPGSHLAGPASHECGKCGKKRQAKDGLYTKGKFLCGHCWRLGAVRKAKRNTG